MAEINSEEKISLGDFENLLLMKNQLILLDKDEMYNLYHEPLVYVAFIANTWTLISNEAAFLYLSKDFLRKIRDVLEIHRYDLTDEDLKDVGVSAENVHESVNGILGALNKIDSEDMSYRRLVVKSYQAYHEKMKSAKFDTPEDFAASIAYDAVVYFTLTGDKKDAEIKKELMLTSINYFMEEVPEFFNDKKVLDKALEVLKDVRKKTKFTDVSSKILVKNTEYRLKEIAKEE